jgi:hypothetical protein
MKNKERVAEAKSKARKFFQDKRANCAESVFKAIHEKVQSDLPAQVSVQLLSQSSIPKSLKKVYITRTAGGHKWEFRRLYGW